MLIKEYRIPLPLTVEEYRIAQLYMIAVSLNKNTKIYFANMPAISFKGISAKKKSFN